MAEIETRKLSVLWLGTIESRARTTDPEGFGNAVDLLTDELIRQVANDVMQPGERSRLEQVVQAMRSKHSNIVDQITRDVKAPYKNLYESHERLTDQKRQHDWATTVDHVKVFLWRTAQAIAFAGIVLGTAYLAHRWGIPLPLSRLIPP